MLDYKDKLEQEPKPIWEKLSIVALFVMIVICLLLTSDIPFNI